MSFYAIENKHIRETCPFSRNNFIISIKFHAYAVEIDEDMKMDFINHSIPFEYICVSYMVFTLMENPLAV